MLLIARMLASVLVVIALAGAASAGDIKAGLGKAQKCEPCHGLDGISKLPDAPNIAGQSEQYLVKELHDFKSGERKNDMMSLIVPDLTDGDIEDLAAYYSAIEIKVVKLPAQ
jgi:cytochrome c553